MNVSKQHYRVSMTSGRTQALSAYWLLVLSLLASLVLTAVTPKQRPIGQEREGGPPELSTHRSRTLTEHFYQWLFMLHQSEVDHMLISKSVHIHREWDYCAWFRLFMSHFPAQRLGACSQSGRDTELKISRFFKVNEKGTYLPSFFKVNEKERWFSREESWR